MITEIFGKNCKRAKVFDLFLSHPYSGYTKTDIKESTGIAIGTLNTFIDKLVEYGIIKPTKRYGNGQLYQINMDSTITQALNSFQNQVADIEIEKEMRKYQKEVDPGIKPIRPFEEIMKREIKKQMETSDAPEKQSEVLFVKKFKINASDLELLEVIKREQPKSIKNLSQIINQDIKTVKPKVQKLAEGGLLKFEPGPKNAKKPVVNYDKIEIEI